MATEPAIVLTGATGTAGSAIAAALLANTDARLVLPHRFGHTAASIIATLMRHFESPFAPRIDPELVAERILCVPAPTSDTLASLTPLLRELGAREIIHAAGCVDYFDVDKLDAGNVQLTRALLDLGTAIGCERFIFLSTAFSSGYGGHIIPERLHGEPAADPTDYTRSKRVAEHMVAQSGLPHVILRPSVIIGDSRDGSYFGRPYGFYQFLRSAERLLSRQWFPVYHVVGSPFGIPLIHLDAFQSCVLAARELLPAGAVAHLVSDSESLPTGRDLWTSWCERVTRPRELHFHAHWDQMPTGALHGSLRSFVEGASVNLEIAQHSWHFESGWMDVIRRHVSIPDATQASLARCQDWYVSRSSRLQGFIQQQASARAEAVAIIVHGANPPPTNQEMSC